MNLYGKTLPHSPVSRKAYFRELADQYDIEYETVALLADMLGPSEDYDGLITALDDISQQYD